MQTFHAASEADNSNSRSFFFVLSLLLKFERKKYKKFKILLLKGCRSAEHSQLSEKNWRKMPGCKNRACVRVYNILQLSRPFRFSALRPFINICIKCTLCHYLDVPFHLVLCISTWINIFSLARSHSTQYFVWCPTNLLLKTMALHIRSHAYKWLFFGSDDKRKQLHHCLLFFNATAEIHYPYFWNNFSLPLVHSVVDRHPICNYRTYYIESPVGSVLFDI